MATRIDSDGTITEVSPANGKTFTVQELQAAVGGYLQALHCDDGRVMYLNEDGKREPLPYNHTATMIMRYQLQAGDLIVGTVIICSLAETGDDHNDDDEEDR